MLGETGFEQVDLLKVDCEGAEFEVFLNAPDALLKRISRIACEYHPVAGHAIYELRQRLEELGFTVEREGGPVGILRAARP